MAEGKQPVYGYDGTAATTLQVEESAAGDKKVKIPQGQRKSLPLKDHARLSPRIVAESLVVVACLMALLISHARLIVVNDQAVSLRNQLNQLQTEGSKLTAQYELNYDLQEIETQMLTSGTMTKAQSYQTYVLELAEPDSVEYFQTSRLSQTAGSIARQVLEALREYF